MEGTHTGTVEGRKGLAWIGVAVLTAIVMMITTRQALVRYEEFRSGWPWDLAYYNQWFWAITHGEGLLTVRPVSAYAIEGPSVWAMNYLAPIRVALLPIYALFPDPRTLLVIQHLVFWCVIPAAYALVKTESRSERLALSAAGLVPLTPLAWPLVSNDFRELQLAVPFVLLAIHGWRDRRVRLATVGIAGMLACRQEFALAVASLALLPPRQPEPPVQTRRWAVAALVIGFGWSVIFFGYLSSQIGPRAPADYLTQFAGTTTTPAGAIGKALDYLLIGLGSWAVMALFAPRVMLQALPWVWVLSSGSSDLRELATPNWHHVRYAAPMTALVLAAGLIGYARFWSRFALSSGRAAPITAWFLLALGLTAGGVVLHDRLARVPHPVAPAEANRLWSLIRQVDPADGVLAAYAVSAPLSGRRVMYGYERDVNRPPGFPVLAPDIRWAFIRRGEFPPVMFTQQGFVEVGWGPFIQVFRRHSRTTTEAAP